MRARLACCLIAAQILRPPVGNADETTATLAPTATLDRQIVAGADRTVWRGFPGTTGSPPYYEYGPSTARSQGALEDRTEQSARVVEESMQETPEKQRSLQEIEVENAPGGDMFGSITAISEQGVGHPMPNRCLDFDLSKFGKGNACGPPLSLPCFDYSRCQLPPEGNPSIYVYDYECTLADSDKVGHRCCYSYLRQAQSAKK